MWKLFRGMNDGQDSFFEEEISNFDLLERFTDIIYWPLDPFFNLYQDQAYCVRCNSNVRI